MCSKALTVAHWLRSWKGLYLRGHVGHHSVISTKTASASFAQQRPIHGAIDVLHPYAYTSGRWLHEEDAQLKSRYIDFDFAALLRKAVDASPGARRVVKYERKLEGGYNRAFSLLLDNDCQLMARIPFHRAGPPTLTTNSEVATIAYLRSRTSIPLPHVLAWRDDSNNPTGTEYIIMSKVPGVQLHKAWPASNSKLHFPIVKTLVDYMCELSQIPFPAYGSIYFDNVALDPTEKIAIEEGFCTGPTCHPHYWPGTPGEPRSYARRRANRGPWRDLHSYVIWLIDSGYSLLPDTAPVSNRNWQGSVDEHLRLLKEGAAVAKALAAAPQVQAVSTPKLLHPDYAKRNIFIDEHGSITGVIDWQFAAVEPTFVYAHEHFDWLHPHDRVDAIAAAELTSNIDDISLRVRMTKIEKRFEILQKLCSVGLQASMPELQRAIATDQRIPRPFRFCGSSWRDGATALREELITVSRDWNLLELPGRCPYQPTTDELAEHKAFMNDMNYALALKMAVAQATDSSVDGWVELERYDEAAQTCRELYAKLVDGETADAREQADIMWPFDVR